MQSANILTKKQEDSMITITVVLPSGKKNNEMRTDLYHAKNSNMLIRKAPIVHVSPNQRTVPEHSKNF